MIVKLAEYETWGLFYNYLPFFSPFIMDIDLSSLVVQIGDATK